MYSIVLYVNQIERVMTEYAFYPYINLYINCIQNYLYININIVFHALAGVRLFGKNGKNNYVRSWINYLYSYGPDTLKYKSIYIFLIYIYGQAYIYILYAPTLTLTCAYTYNQLHLHCTATSTLTVHLSLHLNYTLNVIVSYARMLCVVYEWSL